MRSGRYSQSNKSTGAWALLAEVLIVTMACGQSRVNTPISVTVIQGQQFSHPVQLPSGFRRTNQDTREIRWFEPIFDHFAFRLSASSPDALLLEGCRYENPSRTADGEVEVCSANAFAIDTTGSYAVQEAKPGDWEQGVSLDGFLQMYGGSSRYFREEMKRDPFLRPYPIGRGLEREGYGFRGKDFLRRSKWLTAINFGASADGKLIALAGYDRNKPSHGPFTLDVFDSDPMNRIAALDAESATSVEDRLRRISIVNSRWLVVGVDLDLRQMLLFDFKPSAGEQKK